MTVDEIDSDSFTEEWRLRHDLLINEIRSLQSHMTAGAEAEAAEQMQRPVEPQGRVESPIELPIELEPSQKQIEPQMDTKIEGVEEEESLESDTQGDSGPSWKRQAKELDRLNARLQASLKTSIPKLKTMPKVPSSARSKSPGGKGAVGGLSLSTSKSEGRLREKRRSSSPRSRSQAPQLTPEPSGAGKGLQSTSATDSKDSKDRVQQKTKEREARSSALATSTWPAPTPLPKRPAKKRPSAPRPVATPFQVGAPFDQPRKSVMARLLKAPETKGVETQAPVKTWTIPRLCLEAVQPGPPFSGIVPSTTGGSSYVPSSTSSPQMWYRAVSQFSQVSQVSQVSNGALRHGQPLQKTSAVSQRLVAL